VTEVAIVANVAHTDNGTYCCPQSKDGFELNQPEAYFDACECACNDSTTWDAAVANFVSVYGGLGWTLVYSPHAGPIYYNNDFGYGTLYVAFISNTPLSSGGGYCRYSDMNTVYVGGTRTIAYCYPVFGSCWVEGATYGTGTCYCNGCSSPPAPGTLCADAQGPPLYCFPDGWYYDRRYSCAGSYFYGTTLASGCTEGCDYQAGSNFPIAWASLYVGFSYYGGCFYSPDFDSCPDRIALIDNPAYGGDWVLAYNVEIF